MSKKATWLFIILSAIWNIIGGAICVIFGGADINFIVLVVTIVTYFATFCLVAVRATSEGNEEYI